MTSAPPQPTPAPVPQPDKDKQADEYFAKHGEPYEALRKCFQDNAGVFEKLKEGPNPAVDEVCMKERSDYLMSVAHFFCNEQYEAGRKCQQKAGDKWETECAAQNDAFGQCIDGAMQRIFANRQWHRQETKK